MLVWLSGTDNTEGRAERELRPRADGALHARRGPRAYSEQDVREQARALTGWRTLRRRASAATTSATTRRRTTTGRRRSSARRGNFDVGRTRAGCASTTRTTRRSSCASSGATSSRSPPSRATQPRSSSCTRRATRCGRSSSAILKHPALYTGPRMVKSPVVYTAGLLRAHRARDRHRARGFGSRRSPGSGCSTRRTSRAGTTTRWLDTATFRGRWDLAASRSSRRRSIGSARRPPTMPVSCSHAPRLLGHPVLGAGDARVLLDLRRRALAAPTRTGSAAVPVLSRTRCAS